MKNVLRDRLPDSKSSKVGTNMTELVIKFAKGIEIDSKKVDGIPEVSKIILPLGCLHWNIKHLEDNLKCYISALLAESKSNLKGDLIEHIKLKCLPSNEQFFIELNAPY